MRQVLAIITTLLILPLYSWGIVSYGPLAKEETTQTLSAFEAGAVLYAKERQKDIEEKGYENVLRYYYLKVKDPAVIDKMISELKLGMIQRGREIDLELTLEEFRRIQKDIINRGYEASTNLYWAPPETLYLFNPEEELLGPKKVIESNDGKETLRYQHSLKTRLQLNFQKKGEELQQHELYLRAFLEGQILLSCEEPYSKCEIVYSTIDRAGVEWETIPGNRGGNSSSGGSKNHQINTNLPLIIRTPIPKIPIDKLKIENPRVIRIEKLPKGIDPDKIDLSKL